MAVKNIYFLFIRDFQDYVGFLWIFRNKNKKLQKKVPRHSVEAGHF